MEHTAGLVQGIHGTPTPMVTFLPDAPAALFESITSKVHDVEGIHDRPRAGELFGGGALHAGESIHRDDLNALAPRVGLGGQPGCEDPPGSARDHVPKPRGTAPFSYGSYVHDDSDVPVPVWGVSPHVFIHANDTHAFTPSWIIDQQTRPFSQDSSVGSIPVFRPVRPRRRIDGATARTPTSTPPRMRACRMRGAP